MLIPFSHSLQPLLSHPTRLPAAAAADGDHGNCIPRKGITERYSSLEGWGAEEVDRGGRIGLKRDIVPCNYL